MHSNSTLATTSRRPLPAISPAVTPQSEEAGTLTPEQPYWTLYTVEEFAELHHRFLTPAAIRNQIHRETPKYSRRLVIPVNELAEIGAIVRLGSSILLDEAKYFAWVDQQQAKSSK